MPISGESGSWETTDGAALRAVLRPDGAWWVRLPESRPDAWPELAEAATRDGAAPLLTSRPAEEDQDRVGFLRRAGFTPSRTQTSWRIPLDPRLVTVSRTQHQIVAVTECEADAVADLDNAVRADIPGTQGWVGNGAQLLESLDDPDFDPELYRVARHRVTGTLDGLIRVWNRRPEPRLGCVGLTRRWRRTGLARVLVQDVARTLLDRGVTHITAETDHTNRDSHLMALNHGGMAVQMSTEWRREGPLISRTPTS